MLFRITERRSRLGYSEILEKPCAECGAWLRAESDFPSNRFVAGDRDAGFLLNHGVAYAPVVLFLSTGTSPFPIPLPLSAGCQFNLDPSLLILMATARTDASGVAEFPISIPSIGFGLEVSWQAILAVPAGITGSNGVTTRIG